MEKVIMGTRLPAKLWLNEVEDSCMSQIMDLTSLPFAFKHIAIMPDAHAGKGMPIGGVLATKGVIVPKLWEWISVVECVRLRPIEKRMILVIRI